MNPVDLEQLSINSIRFLAIDGVNKANSGHPGAPMGMAPMAYTLWTKHLRFNPKNPKWFNRDRFVLSNGHASMLLYSMLYLTGYDLSLDDLKQFRQWGSKTPGHPEYGLTPGVEVTTGPLGQGFANAVGMAIAEQHLAAMFNKSGFDLIDHHTYVFMGDGCMEEGITSEAASLAGHLQLGKLIAFYDSNHITIDGNTEIAFTENVHARYEAYNWHVLEVPNGNDVEAIDHAIEAAKQVSDRPSLIICHTHIGFGSPNRQDTAKAHGNPLGKEETALTRQHLHWKYGEFEVPKEALEVFRECGKRGTSLEKNGTEVQKKYAKDFAKEWEQLQNAITRTLPKDWSSKVTYYKPSDGPVATRTIGGKAMNQMAESLPTLFGGAADLNESTFTKLEAFPEFEPSPLKGGVYEGRTINYGIREHAMGAIINGMAAHGGIYPYGSTFLTFSDYMRPAVRLSALMNVPSIFVWTHDSVGLGEDGPTHQPVEHYMALRAIPNFTFIRPADANETVEAWKLIPTMTGPVGLSLTRQKLPVIDQSLYAKAEGLRRGAYVLADAKDAKVILIASGSEVSLALEAKKKLDEKSISTRVVSVPSFELFEAQSDEYKETVLPTRIKPRLSIEMGITRGWQEFVGSEGASLGINHFGASSPYERILKEYGFTVENIVAVVEQLLKDPKKTRERLRKSQQQFTHGHIASAPAKGDEGHS